MVMQEAHDYAHHVLASLTADQKCTSVMLLLCSAHMSWQLQRMYL